MSWYSDVLVATLVALAATGPSRALDNGFNRPSLGWRSWNCFGANVDQQKIEEIMDAMTRRTRSVNGVPTSFADLGYTNAGLDDAWQKCGSGYKGSFHDEEGNPIVDTSLFPSLKNMTSYGHTRGLKVGWYANNCICREKKFSDAGYIAKHMENMAAATVEFGFDAIKLDNCGEFLNLTLWAELLNQTGKAVEIENCHWGQTVPGQMSGHAPCDGSNGVSDCPYNFYRVSTDIKPVWNVMMYNHRLAEKFLGFPPLSRPGAFAYPDMLEVGKLANAVEDRTHFGLWVIISSPLVLGFDLRDGALVDRVWDFVANPEAISINQRWHGHPGYRVSPDGFGTQIWAKPMGDGQFAVLIVNNKFRDPSGSVVSVALASIGFPAATTPVLVRDVWNRVNLTPLTNGMLVTDRVAWRDSRLYMLTISS